MLNKLSIVFILSLFAQITVFAQSGSESNVPAAESTDAVEVSDVDQVEEEPGTVKVDPNLYGSISGQVIDDDGKLLSGVAVTLEYPGAQAQAFGDEVPMTKTTSTDGKGRYRFNNVISGVYSVRFFKEGYRPSVLGDVEVVPGEVASAGFILPGLTDEEAAQDVYQLPDFVVSSTVLDQDGIALEALRKQSPASVDFLTSAEISKFGASDVAEAITRIPGINLVEGQFAVVRGLNDRYVNTLVNGIPVPSTDPTRQGVQLDLFPSGFVSNLVVEKTFLPYMPGNSGGGSIDIVTKDFPDEFTSSFKAGAKLNTNALDNYLRYPVSGNSYLFGTAKSQFAGVPTNSLTPSQPISFAPFANANTGAPVGGTFSGNFGDSFDVFDRKIGYYFGGSYNSSYKTRTGTTQSRFGSTNPAVGSVFSPTVPPGYNPFFPAGGPLFRPGSLAVGELPRTTGLFGLTQSTGDVLIGGLGTIGIDLDKEGLNTLRAVSFISQNGTTIAQRKANGHVPEGQSPENDSLSNIGVLGAGGDDSKLLNQDILYYRERQLISAQLIGNHVIAEIDDMKVDWAISYSKASQDEPDQRVYSYFTNLNTGLYQNSNGADFGNQLRRTWRSIDEDQRFARADMEYDLEWYNDLTSKIQGGFFYESSTRSTLQDDRFYNAANDNFSPAVTGTTPTEVAQKFYDLRVSANQGLGFAQQSTADTSRNIQAYYAMVSFPILSNDLIVTGGARYEVTDMVAEGVGLFGTTSATAFWAQETSSGSGITNGDILGVPAGSTTARGSIDDRRPLPGVSVVYKPIENVVLRGAYSRTLARPSFRELSPYFSTDFVTGDAVLGNPFLQLSEVESWDLRAEYIWDNGDLIAASVFYKNVENPIEKILLQDTNTRSTVTSFFNNPDRAIVKGFEIEVRKNLGFWSEMLEDFSLGANFTMVDASVGIPADVRSTYVTNRTLNIFDPSNPIPVGYYVAPDGSLLSPPTERKLFDQPEYIINADLTYKNPNIGTTVTVAVYAQSEVLTAAGTGGNVGVPDQFSDAYYQLDLIYSQQITEALQFKLSLKNITDTPRGISYDSAVLNPAVKRVSYKQGMDITLAMEYVF